MCGAGWKRRDLIGRRRTSSWAPPGITPFYFFDLLGMVSLDTTTAYLARHISTGLQLYLTHHMHPFPDTRGSRRRERACSIRSRQRGLSSRQRGLSSRQRGLRSSWRAVSSETTAGTPKRQMPSTSVLREASHGRFHPSKILPLRAAGEARRSRHY